MASRSTSRPSSRSQGHSRIQSHRRQEQRESDCSGEESLFDAASIEASDLTDVECCVSDSSYAAALSEFLRCVSEAELDIRENGPRCRVPPDCVCDTASERFGKTYATLRRYLTPPRAKRRFVLPPSLAYLPGVIIAETALQAWMLALNPVGQLYGEVWFLNSDEYLEIKRQAVLEAVAIWDDEYEPVHNSELAQPTSQTNFASLRDRLLALTPTQRRIYDVVDQTPKRGDEIADLADCEEFTARRYLPQLIKLGLIKKCPTGYYLDE